MPPFPPPPLPEDVIKRLGKHISAQKAPAPLAVAALLIPVLYTIIAERKDYSL